MTNEKGIMNIQREIKIKHREKTIEIHSMNKLKKVKVYELKLKRLRLRAQNKCYLDIANKIKRGMTLEQLNQYCIQKEQDDKLLKYLTCFLEAGKGDSCLDEVGIDRTALTTCTQAADAEFGIMAAFNDQASWLSGRYPLFNTDADLNQQYAVGGSPTLVVNGAKANSGRDSASLLRTVCAAFNEAPEECNTELSSGSPSPGFGFTETEGAAIAATCG